MHNFWEIYNIKNLGFVFNYEKGEFILTLFIFSVFKLKHTIIIDTTIALIKPPIVLLGSILFFKKHEIILIILIICTYWVKLIYNF